MATQRTITVNDDKVEQAQKAREGRQPGMKDDPRRIGVPDDNELAPQMYLVKQKSFINGCIVEAGQVVKLPDGTKAGRFLEPVKVVNRKQKEEVTEPAETKPADPLGDIPDAPIPANAQRSGAAAKLKAAKPETVEDKAGEDETGI